MQRAGSVEVAVARTAEVMTVFGTGKLAADERAASAAHEGTGVAGVAIEVVVVAKPAHCPCTSPSTQLGPRCCVGSGEFCWQCRLPPTATRLTSDGVFERLDWMWTLPSTLPSHARHGPLFDWQWKSPLISVSGPWKPSGPLSHDWMCRLPPTLTLPWSSTERQFWAWMS